MSTGKVLSTQQVSRMKSKIPGFLRIIWVKERLLGWSLQALRRGDEAIERLRRRLAPSELVLFRDVTTPWLASALCVAARLRLSELVGEGCSLLELSGRLGIEEPSLKRFLVFLASHGYFRFQADGGILPTPLSHALQQEVGGAFAELLGSPWYRQAFCSENVLHGWKAERTPFEVATGQPFFEYLQAHSDAEALFAEAMTNVTRFCVPFFAQEIELDPGGAVLDVGGGDGELARALVRRYKEHHIAVLDRRKTPGAVEPEVAGYHYHEGDFFQQLPAGYRHLLLKNILHDWDNSQALAILCRCREAVESGASLTVIECLLPEDGQEPSAHAGTFALDWNVWLTLSGRERTASQYGALLKESGWALIDIKATPTPYSLLKARAV